MVTDLCVKDQDVDEAHGKSEGVYSKCGVPHVERFKSTRHVPRCVVVVDSTLTTIDRLSIFDTLEPPSLKQPCSCYYRFQSRFQSLKLDHPHYDRDYRL